MKRIAIGNDFRVSWTLTQLGEAFNVVGKTFDIEVSTAYGVIVVNDVVSEGNVLSFNVPASGQVYTGNYDIRLHITDEQTGQKWRLEQCDAFALVPCGACSDNVEVVQLSSGIVYPSNGLNAYQLAVLNGEYTGDYEGYQKWLARDAESTANDAVNIANEAKENSSTALSTAQQARVVANDAKTAVATKQDTLTLTVKDNGNIVIGNIQGQTKEFMPATPSGDPMHYMYEKCGAVWNGDTGYWELNGLTDMTTEDMRDSYLICNMYSDILLEPAKYMNKLFRTNILGNISMAATVPVRPAQLVYRGDSALEILNFNFKPSGSEIPLYYFNNMDFCFYGCKALRSILGPIKCTNASFIETFKGCKSLTNIKLLNVSKNISFADSPISKESLLCLINNADTATFTITLRADTYAWASVDEDIQAALAVKTNITLQSA